MLRKQTMIALVLLAIPGVGFAQLKKHSYEPITSQVKDAGTYHLATGTWTRGVSQAALAGPCVIYDNTCTVGYYTGIQQGNVLFTSGRIPSTSSPSNATSLTGWADQYTVTGFTFAYCSFSPIVANYDLSFADCYSACDTGGALPEPTAVFHILNAPAGTLSGGQGCWIVNVSLANTTLEFDLGGDCNGVYNNVASTDSFGWSWTQAIPTIGSNAGPIMAGDPLGLFATSGQGCGGPGSGTCFVGAGAGPGSGLDIVDRMEIGNGPGAPGCYWFGGYGGAGGNPFTAFYMQIQGEQSTNAPANMGSSYCAGTTTCPCANAGSGVGGCKNSGSYGARLMATGNASMVVGQDTLELHVYNVNGSKPGLLLRGDNQLNGGAGNPIGDGLICSAGNSQRSQVVMSTALGVAHFGNWNGQRFGSVANVGVPTNFQYWYRDPQGSPCGSGFNFSNAWTVTY